MCLYLHVALECLHDIALVLVLHVRYLAFFIELRGPERDDHLHDGLLVGLVARVGLVPAEISQFADLEG